MLHSDTPGKHQPVLSRSRPEQAEGEPQHLLQRCVCRNVRGWGQRLRRLSGGGSRAGAISRRANGSTCWYVWKLGRWDNSRNKQDDSKVKFTTGVDGPLSLPLPLLPSSPLYRGWRSFALPSLFLAEVAVAPVIFLKIIMAFTKPFFPIGTLPGFPGPSPLLPVSQPASPPPPRAPFSRQQSLVVK